MLEGLATIALGLALGAALAIAVLRRLRAFLFGVGSADHATLGRSCAHHRGRLVCRLAICRSGMLRALTRLIALKSE